MTKALAIIAVIVLLPFAAFAQSRDSASATSVVSINISCDDTNQPPASLRVALFTTAGSQIANVFTRELSTADFRGLSAGNYQVRVSGAEIEESTTSFTVLPRQTFTLVSVRVKRKPTAADTSSTEGSISSATLNIPDKARQEFDKGMQAMGESKLADADKHLSKAVEQYPSYAAAWNARGVVFMRSEKASDAQGMFERAISVDSQFAPAYVNLAKLLIIEKKEAAAEELLTKSISLNPRDPNALAVLANLDLTTGRLDEAVANAQRVHTMPHADLAVAHLIAGMALQRLQLYPDAAAEYRLFLAESPNSPNSGKIRAQLDAIEKQVH